jgi:hypothetical protein
VTVWAAHPVMEVMALAGWLQRCCAEVVAGESARRTAAMTLRFTTTGLSGSRAGRATRATGVAAAARAASALGALTLLLGCDPYVQGNGVFREQSRNVGEFHGVSVVDGLVATVHAGAVARSVVVSGDENVLQYVETQVGADGVLAVGMTNHVPYDSVNPVRVAIQAPAVDLVRALAGAAVIGSDLGGESLTAEASDGGDVRIAGPGGALLRATLHGGERGGGHLDAREYAVQDAVVDLSGGARAELDVSGAITGTARGSTIENGGGGSCYLELLDGATCAP